MAAKSYYSQTACVCVCEAGENIWVDAMQIKILYFCYVDDDNEKFIKIQCNIVSFIAHSLPHLCSLKKCTFHPLNHFYK